MPADRQPYHRASSRLGAAALDRSLSLDGNVPLTFSRQQSKLQRIPSTRGETEASQLADEAIAWCKSTPVLAEVLGNGPVTAEPLSGGLCNDVWRIQGRSGQILVKRAQGFVRAAESVPLAIERQATEAAGLELGYACAPDTFPRVFAHDSSKHFLATEFLEGRRSLSEALQSGDVFPQMGRQVGSGLGRFAAATSPLTLGPETTKTLSAKLEASKTAALAMEEHVFYLPFDPAAPQNDWPDAIDDDVTRLVYKDAKLMAELEAMRLIYKKVGSNTCLVHHDVWSGNILCTPTTCHIIDCEFGGWGPAAYDIGHAIAHFALCATVVRAYADIEARTDGKYDDVISPERRLEQQEWLLDSISEAYDAFTASLAEASVNGLPTVFLEDVLGITGIVMLRWTLGQFNLPENLGVERNSEEFVDATRRAVQVGAAVLRGRRSIKSVKFVAELLHDALDACPSKAKAGSSWWCFCS